MFYLTKDEKFFCGVFFMKTVAVFFGGRSNEREISIITGTFAANLLKGAGYRVVPVYIGEDNVFYTSSEMMRVDFFRTYLPAAKHAAELRTGRLVRAGKPKKTLAQIDCALNCCHGGMGEDGTLSALLRYYKIKSASPDIEVSSVFMDKTLSKIAAAGLHIPVLPSLALREGESAEGAAALGFPVIVKPARLGSSIGIKIAENAEQLQQALQYAYRLDDTVLIERYLPDKRDINCAAYSKNGTVVVSECEEVFSQSDILTFSEKYEGGGERRSEMPADLDKKTADKIKECVKRLYEAFGVRGVVRADFLVSGKEVYFNELNTVPGSLACYLFGEKLTQSRAFLAELIEDALRACGEEKATVCSGILNTAVFSGGKSCKRR